MFDDAAIASLEYAVDHLHVPLIMVLGHTSCGAVTAALEGAAPPGALGKLLNEIRTKCGGANSPATESVDAVVRRYTMRIADLLRSIGPVLKAAVEKNDCAVVPACYSLTEGVVELL